MVYPRACPSCGRNEPSPEQLYSTRAALDGGTPSPVAPRTARPHARPALRRLLGAVPLGLLRLAPDRDDQRRRSRQGSATRSDRESDELRASLPALGWPPSRSTSRRLDHADQLAGPRRPPARGGCAAASTVRRPARDQSIPTTVTAGEVITSPTVAPLLPIRSASLTTPTTRPPSHTGKPLTSWNVSRRAASSTLSSG